MSPGSIFFDKNFNFHDGQDGQKFFIMLGSDSGISVAAKTTSQGARYLNEFGCQIDHRFPNFHLVKNCCCLPKATWVCLDELYEFSYAVILKKHRAGDLYKHGELPSNISRSLVDCALKSEDISQLQIKIIESAIAKNSQ